MSKKQIVTVSVWFISTNNQDKPLYPMVKIDDKYYYNVTISSLQRLSYAVRYTKKLYTYVGALGWSTEFYRK